MSNLKIQGNVSGSGTVTVVSPNTNNNYSLTLPSAGGELITKTITGGVSISAGNLSFDSGYGIDFSATAGTGTSELLNDYEEGTWTPTLASGGTSVTYSTQTGVYTKIGRLVTFQFNFDINTVTPAASTIRFGGLPFTTAATTLAFGGAFVNYQVSFNTNAGDTYHIGANNTEIQIATNTGANRLGTDAGITLTAQIVVSGQYIAA